MRYWGVLVAKLAALAVVLGLGWWGLHAVWPSPTPIYERGVRVQLAPFARDLWYTAAVMVFWLVGAGLMYLALLDQRFRCRTCGRRLRMPVSSGGWNHILMGRPRTDYICAWGHGTLRVPDLGIAGPEAGAWEPIDDMWKELEELSSLRK
jgi:hypothetical protein